MVLLVDSEIPSSVVVALADLGEDGVLLRLLVFNRFLMERVVVVGEFSICRRLVLNYVAVDVIFVVASFVVSNTADDRTDRVVLLLLEYVERDRRLVGWRGREDSVSARVLPRALVTGTVDGSHARVEGSGRLRD